MKKNFIFGFGSTVCVQPQSESKGVRIAVRVAKLERIRSEEYGSVESLVALVPVTHAHSSAESSTVERREES